MLPPFLLSKKKPASLVGTFFTAVTYLAYFSTLKMDMTCSSKTTVYFWQNTRRYIAEIRNVHIHCCENFRSHLIALIKRDETTEMYPVLLKRKV
jgi:hypothetical protein